ncbi:uncharacterized protein EKO05_0010389 [Ascochyta rabiei]|uniref:Uncharacterized protein n=1 Tax=Didymella rabiei TaxID=5454 RepID=A0A162W908_DIDRA|nr:uncharacterized protein EKO05_0010389 [Ascochyta rabiei]KZM18882.1 hypothetical protein ST47_g9964 [Ascochyta rabiei]UPX20147.1 hypothetical protein EKO05_0010389 [Ascochyta rabiei]
MASSNGLSTSKRRPVRRRLPPLGPGPNLRFVVANHPDQFRAGKTMRHVRSHVMYKHRTGRMTVSNDRPSTGLHRSASERAQSTPIPTVSTSEATSHDIDLLVPPQLRPRSSTWTGISLDRRSNTPTPFELQTTVHRTVLLTAAASAQSAPSAFGDVSAFPFPGTYSASESQLDALKRHYINSCSLFCNDRQCLEHICSDPMTFLSHVSVSCVYQDLMNGLVHDSNTTMSAKTRVLGGMADQLKANDATILTTLHLLLSEAGSSEESAFQVHFRGLNGLIHRRGGLSQVPPPLATYVTLLLTTLAMLKGLNGPSILPATSITSHHAGNYCPYISPLYSPHGDFATLRDSCSAHTLNIITDMYGLSHAPLDRNDSTDMEQASPNHDQGSNRLFHSLSTKHTQPWDWIHEAVRLASLIHTHALLHGTTLANAANTTHHDATTTPGAATLLHLLLNALERTDTTHCWGPMRGVFLWVCLLGGAASWTPTGPGSESGESTQPVSARVAWARKCFSLWAIRAVVRIGFAHADATMEALGAALRIQDALDGRGGPRCIDYTAV